MAASLIGKKLGMTRVYRGDMQVPVTVIQAGPCYVSQIKTPDKDGYAAVQIAFEDIKPRRSTRPVIGHDHQAGLTAKRHHREFRVDESELENYELGQELNVDVFESVKFVDVIGTSKGKGFQGVMKRHGFKGQLASHGVERKHRSAGSINAHAVNAGKAGGVKKGKKMAGHMGDERVTLRSLDVIEIDKDKHLILVKGPIPGPKQGLVQIREAIRLYRSKARIASESS